MFSIFTSLHHVTSLSRFSGLDFPGRELLFGGEVSGGVENAASHRGYRYHSQKRSPFPAVLPRSTGETQLPQRSHLCVVGFSCMDTVDCMHCRAVCTGVSFFIRCSKGQWHLNEFVEAAAFSPTPPLFPLCLSQLRLPFTPPHSFPSVDCMN